MNDVNINPNRRFLREEKLPHFFCPGCGAAQVLNYFTQAIDALELDPSEMLTIGGVGCTARIPVYLKSDTFHGVHGRTFAWATGVKLILPELPVIIFCGDGDLASIGGNHFIHAARRNLDVTVVMVNNLNFAMTGGQVAPTTPGEMRTMTTPFGNAEPSFDVCCLAVAAGASHVERWTTVQSVQCVNAIKTALTHKGLSLVEIVAQCPTHYGRYALGTGDPVANVEWIKTNTISLKEAEEMNSEERKDKFICGRYALKERGVYTGTSTL